MSRVVGSDYLINLMRRVLFGARPTVLDSPQGHLTSPGLRKEARGVLADPDKGASRM